jgi:hypothetical protein
LCQWRAVVDHSWENRRWFTSKQALEWSFKSIFESPPSLFPLRWFSSCVQSLWVGTALYLVFASFVRATPKILITSNSLI